MKTCKDLGLQDKPLPLTILPPKTTKSGRIIKPSSSVIESNPIPPKKKIKTEQSNPSPPITESIQNPSSPNKLHKSESIECIETNENQNANAEIQFKIPEKDVINIPEKNSKAGNS